MHESADDENSEIVKIQTNEKDDYNVITAHNDLWMCAEEED